VDPVPDPLFFLVVPGIEPGPLDHSIYISYQCVTRRISGNKRDAEMFYLIAFCPVVFKVPTAAYSNRNFKKMDMRISTFRIDCNNKLIDKI
jgi:hypothetical protein